MIWVPAQALTVTVHRCGTLHRLIGTKARADPEGTACIAIRELRQSASTQLLLIPSASFCSSFAQTTDQGSKNPV